MSETTADGGDYYDRVEEAIDDVLSAIASARHETAADPARRRFLEDQRATALGKLHELLGADGGANLKPADVRVREQMIRAANGGRD